jgi:hypothetical protein
LPSQDTDLDNDSNYNPECMEEDWNYNNFLEGIQFKYNVLANNTQLSTPLNIYNGRGPCLRHRAARNFNTTLECMSVDSHMDYDFSSCWLQTPMSMEGNTWMILDVFVGFPAAISWYRKWFNSLAWCWKWVWIIGNWVGTSHILRNILQLIYQEVTPLLWRTIPHGSLSHDATTIQADKGHLPSWSWLFNHGWQVSSTEKCSQLTKQSSY